MVNEMAFPKEFHIDDGRNTVKHPDRWKWEDAISYMGMEWNDYQLKRNGYHGDPKTYYRPYRFVMNRHTAWDIDTEQSNASRGVWFVSDKTGLTVGIYGIEIRTDKTLPDGRVILIKGDRCVSFDWRGRVAYEDGE